MTVDKVWRPSYREVFGGTSYETMGPTYTEVLKDAESRKRYKPGAASAENTFLRSVFPNNVNSFAMVYTNGYANYDYANYSRGLWFGFCIHHQ